MMRCALTGHRDLPADFDRNALHDRLEELIRGGCDSFLCGMATGFDLAALECIVDLKRRYHVRVEACIPYAQQAYGFPREEKKKYRELLKECDEVTVLSEHYYVNCLLARNRYMVDKCDLLFAYRTKDRGGAAYTVDYAVRKGVKVVFFENPPHSA